MIILDSSTLRGAGLGNGLDLLRTIKAAGIPVGIPWVVLEELAAQKALGHGEAHAAASRALNALQRATPWKTTPSVNDQTDEVRDYWRGFYSDLATVLRPSQEALETAITREANVIPPCKSQGPDNRPVKTGGRDAAIWLTAVEYARDHPLETVYFVSGNTKDFGDGNTGYEPPMDEDLDGIEDRFRHLTSLDDVFVQFAQRAPIENHEVVPEMCARPEVQKAVVAHAVKHWSMDYDHFSLGFEATATDPSGTFTTRAAGWLDVENVEAHPLSYDNIKSYRLGEQDWVTAEVAWELGGYSLQGDWDDFAWAATRYDTRLLLSVQSASATILGDVEPRALDDSTPVTRPQGAVEGEKIRAALAALEKRTPSEEVLVRLLKRAEERRVGAPTPRLRSQTLLEMLDNQARGSSWNRWKDGSSL